jgi:hypothetical protein
MFTNFHQRLKASKCSSTFWILPVDGLPLSKLICQGQEELAGMRTNQIEGNEGFLLVYSVNDRRSFEDLKVPATPQFLNFSCWQLKFDLKRA